MKYSIIAIIILLPGGMRATSKQQSSPPPPLITQTDQLEIQTDRFSGATTIRLKPQVILDTPDHFVTMALEAKIGAEKSNDALGRTIEDIAEKLLIQFEAQAKTISDVKETELHFIIDGKPLKVGESAKTALTLSGRDPRTQSRFRLRELFSNGLTLSQLNQIANGRLVELRVGKYEATLAVPVINTLRDFAREYRRIKGNSHEK